MTGRQRRTAVIALMRDGQPRTVAQIERVILGREPSPHEHFIFGGLTPPLFQFWDERNGNTPHPHREAVHNGAVWVYRIAVE